MDKPKTIATAIHLRKSQESMMEIDLTEAPIDFRLPISFVRIGPFPNRSSVCLASGMRLPGFVKRYVSPVVSEFFREKALVHED